MRYTLKELVDRILESMGGDEVNTIADTAESLAVANIVKECYFEIISEIQPKETEGLFHLDASTDNLQPTVMFLPSEVSNIQWLKYNIGDSVDDPNFRDLCYLPLSDFLNYSDGLDPAESWVGSETVEIQGQDFVFKFRSDESPKYWTSPDDVTLIFDSYDSTYETTLTSSRTYGFGGLVPVFTMTDTFVPKLDPRQFQLLLNAAKAQAFVELKQTTNEKAERKERRHRALGYKTKDNTDPRTPIQKRKGYGR
jgi:hypothetical protein